MFLHGLRDLEDSVLTALYLTGIVTLVRFISLCFVWRKLECSKRLECVQVNSLERLIPNFC